MKLYDKNTDFRVIFWGFCETPPYLSFTHCPVLQLGLLQYCATSLWSQSWFLMSMESQDVVPAPITVVSRIQWFH